MKKLLYKQLIPIFVIIIPFLFIACGGGGGGGGNGSANGSGYKNDNKGGSEEGGNAPAPPPADSYSLMILQKDDGTTFAPNNDLSGTWNYHGLVSGDSPNEQPRWYYGQLSIDSTGTITPITYTDSIGGLTPPLGSALTLASDGIVTDPADTSSYGVMNSGKDLIVMNKTDNGFHLLVLQKADGTNFIPDDLIGTWNNHCVVSGDTQWLGWERDVLDFIDNSGSFAFKDYKSSDPNRTTANAITFNIAADGIISSPSSSINSFHGAMSSNRDLMVGTIDDKYGGYKLCLIQKADYSTGNFTLDDLAYGWNFHGITTGNAPEWSGWLNGNISMDAIGGISQLQVVYSDGIGDTPPFNSVINMTSGGILTDPANPSFHGTMNVEKNLVIATMD